MPRQAVALKKYRRGTSCVSKTSDNEHATPSLGYSEELSVQDPVGPPVPEFFQPPEEGSKRPSAVRTKDTGDVLPNHPAGPCSVKKAKKLKRELTTLAIQSRSEPGDAKVLARGSSHKKVDCSNVVFLYQREVAEVRYIRIVMREDRAREWLDFGKRCGLPSKRMPRSGSGLDARADAKVS
jgi:hypothetical protein